MLFRQRLLVRPMFLTHLSAWHYRTLIGSHTHSVHTIHELGPCWWTVLMAVVCVCVQQGAVAPLDLIIKHLRGVGLPERFSDRTHAEDDV